MWYAVDGVLILNDTLEPALIITGEYVQRRGLTNVADALNETPGFGTGVTSAAPAQRLASTASV